MKNYLFTLCALLITTFAYCQIKFEKGYFIENNGNRVSCLIRNSDWKNNPVRFRFRLEGDAEIQTAEMAEVREFGITGSAVYRRHEVDIDRRSYLASNLNADREPQFKRERLFLKLLVKGKADLLSFADGNLVRYFYSLDNQQPEQLVYTRYKSREQKILENFYYKSQLSSQLNCEQISSSDIDETDYREADLISYFSRFNGCFEEDYTVLRKDAGKSLFHLRVRPGADFTSFKTQYYQTNVPDTDFGLQLSYRLGAELEMVLPFNKNKWAFTFEPFYRSYKAENDNDTYAKYSSLVTAFGLRHYFFLGEESKIFLNGNFGLDFPFNSDFRVASSVTTRNLEVTRNMLDNYWALGTGFNWNDKLSVELRYMFNQDLLMQYEFWTANYSSISIILGYNLF